MQLPKLYELEGQSQEVQDEYFMIEVLLALVKKEHINPLKIL